MGQLFGSESAYIIPVDVARAAVKITVAENEELLPRFDLRREAGKRDDEGEDATELGKRMHEADGARVRIRGAGRGTMRAKGVAGHPARLTRFGRETSCQQNRTAPECGPASALGSNRDSFRCS